MPKTTNMLIKELIEIDEWRKELEVEKKQLNGRRTKVADEIFNRWADDGTAEAVITHPGINNARIRRYKRFVIAAEKLTKKEGAGSIKKKAAIQDTYFASCKDLEQEFADDYANVQAAKALRRMGHGKTIKTAVNGSSLGAVVRELITEAGDKILSTFDNEEINAVIFPPTLRRWVKVSHKQTVGIRVAK